MAAPRTPVSPGHFDRFNFCNAAPGFDLVIESVTLAGVNRLPAPITVGPMGIDHINVCWPDLNATTFTITGKVTQGGVDTQFNVNYTTDGSFLNNVVFGAVERCVDGATDAVFFGDVEYSSMATPEPTWVALQQSEIIID